MLATGMYPPFEKEYVTKDGKRVPVLVGGTRFYQKDFAQSEIAFVLDLTARKEAEEQRQEANRKVAALLESITDGFMHLDTEWRYVSINERMKEIIGKKREELQGQRI